MAIGPHRVQLIKDESTVGGGDPADNGPFGDPGPIEPQEDAIEVAGVYLQDAVARDEQVYIARETDELFFCDPANPGGYTLAQLAASGGGAVATQIGQTLMSLNGTTFTPVLQLVNDCGDLLTNDEGYQIVTE